MTFVTKSKQVSPYFLAVKKHGGERLVSGAGSRGRPLLALTARHGNEKTSRATEP